MSSSPYQLSKFSVFMDFLFLYLNWLISFAFTEQSKTKAKCGVIIGGIGIPHTLLLFQAYLSPPPIWTMKLYSGSSKKEAVTTSNSNLPLLHHRPLSSNRSLSMWYAKPITHTKCLVYWVLVLCLACSFIIQLCCWRNLVSAMGLY